MKNVSMSSGILEKTKSWTQSPVDPSPQPSSPCYAQEVAKAASQGEVRNEEVHKSQVTTVPGRECGRDLLAST